MDSRNLDSNMFNIVPKKTHQSPPLPEAVASARYSSSAAILLSSQTDPVFDRITSLAKRLFNVPSALVTIIDDDCFWIKSSSGGADLTNISKGDAFCTYLFTKEIRNVFIVEDASKDERFKNNRLVVAAPHIRFYAGNFKPELNFKKTALSDIRSLLPTVSITRCLLSSSPLILFVPTTLLSHLF